MATHGRTAGGPGVAGGRTAGERTHLSLFSGIPDLLESFDIPSASLLQRYGLTDADLQDPDRTVSFRDMSRLLEDCMRATRCAHLGLLLSRTADLSSLGLVGRLARHSPTVGEGLEVLGRYFSLHDTGGNIDVTVESGTAMFTYTLHATGIASPDLAHEFVAGTMVNVLRQLCGEDWRPSLVLLRRKRPSRLAPYCESLGDSLEFNSARTAVAFPARWLAHPVAGADPLLRRLLLREVCAGFENQGPMVRADVRKAITTRLQAGHCSRREVALALGLHERTLCRCLQASGTTFQQLLDEVRSELAQQLIRETRASMSQIAHELGFRNSTVMARAFRRWHGVSPREYRSGMRRPH